MNHQWNDGYFSAFFFRFTPTIRIVDGSAIHTNNLYDTLSPQPGVGSSESITSSIAKQLYVSCVLRAGGGDEMRHPVRIFQTASSSSRSLFVETLLAQMYSPPRRKLRGDELHPAQNRANLSRLNP
jgi:hypothetical protein